jgi:hypothetical protein
MYSLAMHELYDGVNFEYIPGGASATDRYDGTYDPHYLVGGSKPRILAAIAFYARELARRPNNAAARDAIFKLFRNDEIVFWLQAMEDLGGFPKLSERKDE